MKISGSLHYLTALASLAVVCAVATSVQAATHVIIVKNFEFVQNFDTVQVGDTIQWVWTEGEHTTTSNGIPAGAQPWNVVLSKLVPLFSYRVSVAGRYDYISIPHAPLMGRSFYAVGNTSSMGQPVMDCSLFCTGTELLVCCTLTDIANISIYNLTGQRIAATQVFTSGPCIRLSLPAGFLSTWIVDIHLSSGRMVRKVVCR